MGEELGDDDPPFLPLLNMFDSIEMLVLPGCLLLFFERRLPDKEPEESFSSSSAPWLSEGDDIGDSSPM